jgi:hypothetical protein
MRFGIWNFFGREVKKHDGIHQKCKLTSREFLLCHGLYDFPSSDQVAGKWPWQKMRQKKIRVY